jgi:hypothetical protein
LIAAESSYRGGGVRVALPAESITPRLTSIISVLKNFRVGLLSRKLKNEALLTYTTDWTD